jgi:hypothetical protein
MEYGLLEAARAIRPYLAELVGPAAASYDGQIAELLASASSGRDVTDQLRTLLNGNEATSSYVDAVLADAPRYRPPAVQPSRLRDQHYQGLPGDVGPIMHAGEYRCPQGDYVWYRPASGVAIESCPTHGPGLVRT